MGCQEPRRSPSSSLPSPQPPSPLSGLSPSAHFAEALPGQFQAAALTRDGDPRPGPQTPRQRASLLPAEGARGGAPRMAARSRRAVRTPHPAPRLGPPALESPHCARRRAHCCSPTARAGLSSDPHPGERAIRPCWVTRAGCRGQRDTRIRDTQIQTGASAGRDPHPRCGTCPSSPPRSLRGLQVCVCACARVLA